MADTRYKVPMAVLALIIRERDGKPAILLQRRQNTGYCDGMWDVAASGHVEAGEAMAAAMARELREEIGLTAEEAHLRMATISYSREQDDPDDVYIDVFFYVDAYAGEPRIMEPEKCDGLAWFPLEALPGDIIPGRLAAIRNALAGIPFSEAGFGG